MEKIAKTMWTMCIEIKPFEGWSHTSYLSPAPPAVLVSKFSDWCLKIPQITVISPPPPPWWLWSLWRHHTLPTTTTTITAFKITTTARPSPTPPKPFHKWTCFVAKSVMSWFTLFCHKISCDAIHAFLVSNFWAGNGAGVKKNEVWLVVETRGQQWG